MQHSLGSSEHAAPKGVPSPALSDHDQPSSHEEPSSDAAATAGQGLAQLAQKEAFMGFLAHELRTPLTPVMMLLQSLERKAKNGQADVDAIARARRQTIRLARMIGDLVDLSKLRDGRLELDRSTFDFSELLSEVVETFRGTMPKQRIDLVTPGPCPVFADRARLERLISNLIDHCERSLSPNGTLGIQLQTQVGREGSLRLSLGMTGPSAQASGPLPDPETVRPDGPLSQLRGPNLGLCLVQEVAKRHGGGLGLETGAPSTTTRESAPNQAAPSLVLTLPIGAGRSPT